jgi:hypothetical protein
MSEWRSYHIYYGDLDSLILGCVHPFLERARPRLERVFWERHFAGGPHLRVRLRGSGDEVSKQGSILVREGRRFLAGRPSANLATYSEARAAALMEKEGEVASPEELMYRNNTVEEHAYRPPRQVFASDDAVALAEDFRNDSMPLAARVLGEQRSRSESLLRLFFLQALVVTRGDMPGGCVACRSHWEGFAATFGAPQPIERIRESQRANRGAILEIMREVTERFEQGILDQDPLLAGWRDLLETYRSRTLRDLAEGKQITQQPQTLEEARQARERVVGNLHTESAFVDTFWSDERFIASLQYEPSWLVPRVLVNLLYQFVATVGIGPIDRMALCYYVFRAAEEHYDRDLNEILKGNIAKTSAAHSERWATA